MAAEYSHLTRMGGIVLYDCLQVKGGAERVTLDIVIEWSGTDLCVGYRVAKAFPNLEINGCRLFVLMHEATLIGWRTIKQIAVFLYKTHFLKNYDWVIYSGSYAPLAVRNHPKGLNIFYCHTIPRFAYDLHEYYLSKLRWWQRPLMQALVLMLKKLYEPAVHRMDVIVANSENVKRRIKRYLKKDAVVIYPPCDTEKFQWLGQDNYYISLSRLESYKRVNLIVNAFKLMPDLHLVVTSGGSQLDELRALANGCANITFTGWLPETDLNKMIGNAIASIYIPKDEDFGMSPVESMAAGKPVIGVAEGGLLETIVHNKTGLLLPENPTVVDIINAVKHLTPEVAAYMRTACEERAQLFRREVFFKKMKQLVGC